jgi:hypothetical protein
MSVEFDVWELRKDEVVVGRLRIYDMDMFWADAHFEPTPEYEKYRPVFDSQPYAEADDEVDQWDTWMKQVMDLGLKLVRLRDNVVCKEFILYIRDDKAAFRGTFDAES